MAAATFRDDPWRRMPWLLPAAAGLALLSLMGFLKLLAGPPLVVPVAPAIEVDVVELTPSPPAPHRSRRPRPSRRRLRWSRRPRRHCSSRCHRRHPSLSLSQRRYPR